MARKIVITSGKGGVGKTTVAANLGMRLAAMGERVVLADADFGLNNIDVVCGVENLVTYDIVDAIEGRCRTRQALVQHPEYPNLFILASNHTDPGKYISPQAVRLILDNLAPRFDYILIDSPAGIEGGFHRAVAAAEEALVVTTPHISSLRDADKVIAVLKSYKLKSVDLVINMVRGDMIVDGHDRRRRNSLSRRNFGNIEDSAHRHRPAGGRRIFGRKRAGERRAEGVQIAGGQHCQGHAQNLQRHL